MLSDRIGKIEKARLYALEADRFFVSEQQVQVRGDHGDYTLSRGTENNWICDCGFHRRHGWCAHSLAFEWYCENRPGATSH